MADAGEMRGGLERRLVDDALDCGVGALARAAAGAVGDGDKGRLERLQAFDCLPQRLFRFVGLGRREFERDVKRARVGDEVFEAHAALAFLLLALSASQSFTVSSSFAPLVMASDATGVRPAAANQPCTSRSAKPRRRCAKSVRRNSSSCGAKSAISKRPPSRITRAASITAACGSSRKCSTWWNSTASKPLMPLPFGNGRR